MDNFLNRYQIPKLNQDHIDYLNGPITPNEIEVVIDSLHHHPPQKKPVPDGFSAEFCQTFKENLTPICFKLFHKIEIEGTLPNLFYEATILRIPKPHKDPTKKENIRPMDINAKTLNKSLANQIQEHIKMIIHNDQVGHRDAGMVQSINPSM